MNKTYSADEVMKMVEEACAEWGSNDDWGVHAVYTATLSEKLRARLAQDAEKPEGDPYCLPGGGCPTCNKARKDEQHAISALHGGPVNPSEIPDSSGARCIHSQYQKTPEQCPVCIASDEARRERETSDRAEAYAASRVSPTALQAAKDYGGPAVCFDSVFYSWLPALLDLKPGWRRVEGKA